MKGNPLAHPPFAHPCSNPIKYTLNLTQILKSNDKHALALCQDIGVRSKFRHQVPREVTGRWFPWLLVKLLLLLLLEVRAGV